MKEHTYLKHWANTLSLQNEVTHWVKTLTHCPGISTLDMSWHTGQHTFLVHWLHTLSLYSENKFRMLWTLNIVAKYPTKYSFNIISCNAPEMWSLLGQPILLNLIWLVKYLVKCNQLLFHEMLVKCKKHFTAVKYCLPFILKNFPEFMYLLPKHLLIR